jgi:Glycosyl transferase family 11
MVLVKLMGGMGNQMFQYALGRHLAHNRSDELFLSIEALPLLTPPRSFELGVFNISGRVISFNEIVARGAKCIWVASDLDFRFSSEIVEGAGQHQLLCLAGWWQSEKYFKGISPILRQEFTFKDAALPPGPAAEFVNAMEGVEAVCVHVRRADYLETTDSKGFLGLGYYKWAVQEIKKRISRPHLFVFSDDVEWCQEHLELDAPSTVVRPRSDREARSSDDLYLMTLCKHFIIANSTYSWWAAWLGKHERKVVIAPKGWFRSERDSCVSEDATLCSVDLIPEEWIRV